MGRRSLDKLNKQLSELETRTEDFDITVDSVSSASIGWHLEHAFLVINGVVDTLVDSDPVKFKRKFNFARLYCFALKKFPRGKVKAPRPVRPEENRDKDQLVEHLKLTRANIQRFATADEIKFFRHKIFGDLRLDKTIFFLELHTEHHLKIVREIVMNKISTPTVKE